MPLGKAYLDDSRTRNRVLFQITLFFGILFFLLVARLVYLQVVKGDYHYRLSLNNMMRLKIVKAPRGRIFDRTGKLLVTNRASYSIVIYPYKVKDAEALFGDLVKITMLDGQRLFTQAELQRKYKKAILRKFDPTVLAEDVGMDLVSIIEEHTLDLPGVAIETEIRRNYPYGSMGFHLFGYISEIPEKTLESLKNFGYIYGDLIGKAGVEKHYEPLFRGQYGQEYIEVNAFGKELGSLDEMPKNDPIRGHDLLLTIDFDVQMAAEQAFPDSLKGAVVALDPYNGEVIALLSSPRPDPNLFTYSSKKRTKLWAEVTMDPKMPLNNRAIHGTYPPASTFKMITSIAGLEENITTVIEKPVTCKGAYRFGRRNFRCWLPSGHGRVNMIDAIGHSCDVYFYQLGLRTGVEKMNRYAIHFGLGRNTNIDLPGEKSGMLLDEASYNKKFKSKGWVWTKGMLLNLSIGQGQITTPMQLANYIAGIGNGKEIFVPRVLKEIRYSDNRSPKRSAARVLHRLTVKDTTLRFIRQALYKTVHGRGRTGGRARVLGIDVGGKTGSAENPQGEKTHALFVAIAPVDSPRIAVSVVMENAGHGGTIAAPIAGKVIEAYFKKYPLNPGAIIARKKN